MTRRQVVAALMSLAITYGCSRGRVSVKASADARRVVSVSPALTEALFALGDGDRVVGRSRYCDWPPEVKKLPVVGGMIDPNFETIVQLEPDLVVGTPGPSSDKLANRLRSIGIATWFPEIDSFDAIDQVLAGLGERTGHSDQAKALIEAVHDRTQSVERAVAELPKPRVLLVVDVAPPVGTGPRDFLDEMIDRAGGQNVLTSGTSWQTLDFEQIATLDPDIIVDSSVPNGSSAPAITALAPGWKNVRAVREGHVVVISDERVLRPGPRVAEGLALLARVLHPGISGIPQ